MFDNDRRIAERRNLSRIPGSVNNDFNAVSPILKIELYCRYLFFELCKILMFATFEPGYFFQGY